MCTMGKTHPVFWAGYIINWGFPLKQTAAASKMQPPFVLRQMDDFPQKITHLPFSKHSVKTTGT